MHKMWYTATYPPQGTSTILVEQSFTASQAQIQWVSSQNLSNNTVFLKENIPKLLDLPKAPLQIFPDTPLRLSS